ncbi:MAG: Rossmann-like and DUF2520 domain-containing protein [Cytophagaceae bacterium]
MNISFIGAGNVAWHLAPAFENVGCKVGEVYSRDFENAKKLTSYLFDAEPVSALDFSESRSRVFIVSVPDDVISQISDQLIVPEDALVVHTSGACSMNLLNKHNFRGVLYPLQTFTKGRKLDVSGIPFFLEAIDDDAYQVLKGFAQCLSNNLHMADKHQRLALHTAAVFACNFTNHFLSISGGILDKTELPFEVLYPLVRETVEKAFELGPDRAQTGPAVRKDVKTIQSHLDFLEDAPTVKEMYKILSKSILKNG